MERNAVSTFSYISEFDLNVPSVLLYGSETWKTNARCESHLRGFEGCCLRRNLKILWEQGVTNAEMAPMTGINNINDKGRKRAEIGKTWNELRWLSQDRSEWWKLVCACASQGA
ncbi:hypothetical protein BsWGS_12003 [Bradybaena similaris]